MFGAAGVEVSIERFKMSSYHRRTGTDGQQSVCHEILHRDTPVVGLSVEKDSILLACTGVPSKQSS